MAEQLTHQTVTIDSAESGELTFDLLRSEVPDGPQLVALHGFPQGARAWTGVAEILAEQGIALTAIDQRGYSPGARPVGVEHYRDYLLAGDVLAVADALGLDRFHLAGHDWGSHVAWVTAVRHPERLLSLTAVSIPHPQAFGAALRQDPDQARRSEYIRLFWQEGTAEEALLADDARWLRDALGDVDDADKEHYVSRLQQPGALSAALSWYRAMRQNEPTDRPVTVPTTLVWSDQDDAVGRACAELCARYVDADYRFVELNGVTHWIPERAPQALAAAIADRIRTVSE